MAQAAKIPNLDGLLPHSQRTQPDIKPTLLRVMTEMYVQKPAHTPAEDQQYTRLALALIDRVDAESRAATLQLLWNYAAAPVPVVQRLMRDTISAIAAHEVGAVPPPAAYPEKPVVEATAPQPPAAPAGVTPAPAPVAPRQTETRREPTPFETMAPQIAANLRPAEELSELFFTAYAEQRRLILLNLPFSSLPPAKPITPLAAAEAVARLEIAGERSAGAVQLLDKRWRRRSVGVISGATADTAQPLLASTYYLGRALNPFADVRMADNAAPAEAVRRFIEQNVPMIVLADVGNVAGEVRDRLTKWVDNGGMLVRFAGPRLAASTDDLVPVKLRRGGRTLGGSLSWDQPQALTAFSKESPFGTMALPNDVTVTRQVLAEPEAGLVDRTWATLADGTPLVTAVKRGKGMIVLFHVTADTRWSDLPLSGSFVEMLRRIVSLAGSTTTKAVLMDPVTHAVVASSTSSQVSKPDRLTQATLKGGSNGLAL